MYRCPLSQEVLPLSPACPSFDLAAPLLFLDFVPFVSIPSGVCVCVCR